MMQQKNSRTITRNDLIVSSSLGITRATHTRTFAGQLFLSSRHNRCLETELYGGLLLLSPALRLSINFHYTIVVNDVGI